MLRPYECYYKDGAVLRARFRKSLGLQLKLEREKRALTEMELSRLLQVKVKTIIRMENGLCRIDYSALCRMLQFYDKWGEVRLSAAFHPKEFD